MKRLLAATSILSIIYYLVSSSLAYAQEFNFNRAYNDYLYTYGLYRQAHTEYISTRQAYLNYQTLTSKTEALNKTLEMLKLRDEVVRTYLTSLRLKLAETTGISSYDQNVLYLRLDDEINWYEKHRDALPSAGSLDDLVNSSQDAQEKYQTTEILIYQTLGTILGGKETALRDELEEQVSLLKDKIGQIRQNGDKQTTVIERWLLDAENRLTRSQEKQDSAKQILTRMQAFSYDKNQSYDDAHYALKESHQYLKETNFNLTELIREVKSAD